MEKLTTNQKKNLIKDLESSEDRETFNMFFDMAKAYLDLGFKEKVLVRRIEKILMESDFCYPKDYGHFLSNYLGWNYRKYHETKKRKRTPKLTD